MNLRKPARILAVIVALAAPMMAVREARSGNAAAYFLVATREMPDARFAQSVILMLPSTQPPLVAGLIINRPTIVPLRELFPRVPALKDQTETAYFGGPVEVSHPWLLVRAAAPKGDAQQVLDDVYLSTDPDSIAETLRDARGARGLRLFLGRSQWTADQLHAEILERSWYVAPANVDMVFSANPGRIWHDLVQRAELQEVHSPPILEPPAAGFLSNVLFLGPDRVAP